MTDHILEIQNGKHQGRRVRVVETDVIVGRDEAAKIRIGSSDVSRRHCSLTPRPEGLLVTDLGSSNGTFVNGRPIDRPTLMAPGDTLSVGPMVLKLMGSPTAKTPPRADKSGGQGLSDDDIASWLTDDALPVATGDTAVTHLAGSGTVEVELPPSAPADFGKKKKFKNIAEEAQDIIRRHFKRQSTPP